MMGLLCALLNILKKCHSVHITKWVWILTFNLLCISFCQTKWFKNSMPVLTLERMLRFWTWNRVNLSSHVIKWSYWSAPICQKSDIFSHFLVHFYNIKASVNSKLLRLPIQSRWLKCHQIDSFNFLASLFHWNIGSKNSHCHSQMYRNFENTSAQLQL